MPTCPPISQVFPEGQIVAVKTGSERVVGMAASLIILWDDYDVKMDWEAFTDRGMFRNHDRTNGPLSTAPKSWSISI